MLPSWSKIDCSPTPRPWSSPRPSASTAAHVWVPLLDGSARFSADNHPKAQSNASQAHRSCGQFEDSSHEILHLRTSSYIQPLNTYTQIVRYLIHLHLRKVLNHNPAVSILAYRNLQIKTLKERGWPWRYLNTYQAMPCIQVQPNIGNDIGIFWFVGKIWAIQL